MGQLLGAVAMFEGVEGSTYLDVIAILKKLGKPTNLRGDAVFALVRKIASLARYPNTLYQM